MFRQQKKKKIHYCIHMTFHKSYKNIKRLILVAIREKDGQFTVIPLAAIYRNTFPDLSLSPETLFLFLLRLHLVYFTIFWINRLNISTPDSQVTSYICWMSLFNPKSLSSLTQESSQTTSIWFWNHVADIDRWSWGGGWF